MSESSLFIILLLSSAVYVYLHDKKDLKNTDIWKSLPFWAISLVTGFVAERFLVPRLHIKAVSKTVQVTIVSSVLLFMILHLWKPRRITDADGKVNERLLLAIILLEALVSYFMVTLVYPRVYEALRRKKKTKKSK